MNSMVVPRGENSHTANTERLTPSQKDMLLSMSDSDGRDKVIYLIMNPERFMDLCWLIHYKFAKTDEVDGMLVVRMTLPGMYARGIILKESGK